MDVTRVPVPTDTRAPVDWTCAYLLGSDPAVLVDPAATSDHLDAAVDDRTVSAIAVTHHHPDHVGAVAHYADRTGATVYCRAGRERLFRHAAGTPPDDSLRAGDALPADDGTVTVLDTPGHAPEHIAFAAGTDVVTGDLVVADGSVVVGAPEGDMRAYLTSLRRLHARAPGCFLPAHGPVVDEPRAACARLIAHRLDRERRVRAAVRAGARTPDEILDQAYDRDLAGVRDLARATVIAHLEKLAVEATVEWDGSRAVPTDESERA
ncbi:MAG: MBL fold metallo-hydrolase [Haloarculaceae archaeon]